MSAFVPRAGFRLALLMALVSQPLGAVSASDRCYGDWSDAAPIVARERLRPARDIHDRAKEWLGGAVVRIVLCEAGGQYHYRVLVRREDGRIAQLTVEAVP